MQRRTFGRAWWVISTAGLALAASAGPALGQQTPTHADLVYATVGGTPLRLDLYIPAGAPAPMPVVIHIHGGGWQSGNKSPLPQYFNQVMLDGMAAAAVQYRLTSQAGQFGAESVTFPAQIHDVKAAVRWLRANAATYGLDPHRIGVWGGSAGGHLAALLGTSGGDPDLEGTVGDFPGVSSRVQAVVDYFGPTDLLQMNADVTTPPGSIIDHDAPTSPESRLIGWDDPGQGLADVRNNLLNPDPPYPQLVTLLELANPINFVDASDPAFFIAHGDQDTSVALNQSQRLADALDGAGVYHDFRVVSGRGHGNLGTVTNNAAVAFLEQELFSVVPECLGDANGDTTLDAFDFNSFVDAFNSGNFGVADQNADTTLDAFDFNAFVDNFNAGCP